ncbi:MAG: hypothetical protein IPG17_21145 [Sandaracinaceae bacterium]|nr:hypothetical protein [Sandaracinaceae bacterium]
MPARTTPLSQQDWLEGTLDFTRIQFSETPCTSAPTSIGVTSSARCTPRDDLTMLQLGLRHRFTRTTEATLRAGAAVAGTQSSAGAPYLLHAGPLVGATLAHRTRDVNAQTVYSFGAQLSPIVAQQTGAIDRRLQGDASVEWTSQRLSLRASARGSQSIPFDVSGAYLVANMETSVGVQLDRYVTVSLGERIDWQRYASGQSFVGGSGSFAFKSPRAGSSSDLSFAVEHSWRVRPRAMKTATVEAAALPLESSSHFCAAHRSGDDGRR